MWDEENGVVQAQGSSLFEGHTLVGSASGVKNNKMKFFIVLAFVQNFDFKKDSVIHFAKSLKIIAKKHVVDIEDVESFAQYVSISALIPFDVAPADFIEETIGVSNLQRKKIFKENYLVTNVKKPTVKEIMTFLKVNM